MKTSELLRKACIYAEQDRLGLIDVYSGNPEEPVVADAFQFLKELKAYRIKRWGKTKLEVELEGGKRLVAYEQAIKEKLS